MSRAPGRSRRPASVALAVLTALLLAAAAVSGYTRSVLVDQEEFSTRAAGALDDADFRTVLADKAVSGLASSAVPNVLVVRPLVVPAVAAVAGRPAFRSAFKQAIGDRHRALTDGDETFRFQLRLGEGALFDALRRVAPRVASAVPPDLRVPIFRLDPKEFELAGARLLVDLASWWWPLLIAAVAAGAGCALLAGSARGALAALAIAAAGAGLLVAAGVALLGELVASHAAQAADLTDEAERGAIDALWSALFSDLLSAGLLAALGGAVVAILAARGLPGGLPSSAWRGARRWAGSTSRAARLGRAAGLIALGVALVLEPALVARVALVGAGVLAVLAGAAQLSGGEQDARRPAPSGRDASPLLLAGAVAATVAATVVAVSLVLPAPDAKPVASAAESRRCNGSRALCARRLDEVAFAATHNSYAAADEPAWLFASQRYGIERQLRDGIRALLIDVHYGARDPARERVRTDLRAEGSSRSKVARELSPRALRLADRIAGRVGRGRLAGERRPYLCHTLCELGAEPLDEQLRLIADFLAANRREVVVLFIEPYVSVDVVEPDLEAAGLLDQAARLSPGEPLPTLAGLIRAGTRLVILAEQDGGARPWYLPGFSFVQDTPLGATTPAELRCGRYRGRADSPLLLLNHWIPPFPPSVPRNERIGGEFLKKRMARCERRRGMMPNLVAVDFYERSGVVEAVRELNAERG